MVECGEWALVGLVGFQDHLLPVRVPALRPCSGLTMGHRLWCLERVGLFGQVRAVVMAGILSGDGDVSPESFDCTCVLVKWLRGVGEEEIAQLLKSQLTGLSWT